MDPQTEPASQGQTVVFLDVAIADASKRIGSTARAAARGQPACVVGAPDERPPPDLRARRHPPGRHGGPHPEDIAAEIAGC